MRSLLLLLLLLRPGTYLHARTEKLPDLRTFYYRALTGKAEAQEFLQATDAITYTAAPMLRGYKGMAIMMNASYVLNPYGKLSCFRKGKALLEQAVKDEPHNVEIRFLRFCAQTNAPFFLGYNNAINDDKAVILRSWARLQDNDLKEKIRAYFNSTKYCNEHERTVFYE